MNGAIEVVGAGGYVVCGAGDGNVGFYGGGDFVAPQVTFLSPFGADLAMSGVKLSLQPVKSCIRDGSDHSLCIAGASSTGLMPAAVPYTQSATEP